MNCFSACKDARWLLPGLLILIAACGVPDSESADRGNEREYSVHYRIEPLPSASQVRVSMRLRQPGALLREYSFAISDDIDELSADGELVTVDGRVRWSPPRGGGTLSWRATMLGRRGDASYDALLTGEWGLFRMEDIIPRAHTRTLKGALSRTTLEFDLPVNWSAITEYSSIDNPILVERPGRRFDQPTGWIAMGKLGVRRETIAGTRVAIAAPEGQDVRRMDMLALLNWTLPELHEILPDALPRLTIVSAGDPMWRGGLSAPASLFIHADRPLISENGTSTLMHEVLHAALGIRPRQGHDWIAEGLAEYYSIELLRRGNAITAKRARAAFEWQEEWADQSTTLCAEASTAETTARAVGIFAALNEELVRQSAGKASLDTVVAELANGAADLSNLTEVATAIIGATPDTLHIDALPGCHKIAADNRSD